MRLAPLAIALLAAGSLPLVPAHAAAPVPVPYTLVLDPTNTDETTLLHCTVTTSTVTGYWNYDTITATCPTPTIPDFGPLVCARPAAYVEQDGSPGRQYTDVWASCATSTAHCQVGSPFTLDHDHCFAVGEATVPAMVDDGGSIVCKQQLAYFDHVGYSGSKSLCFFGAVSVPPAPVLCIEVLAADPFVYVSTTAPCDPDDPACVGLSSPGPLLEPQPLNCLFPDPEAARSSISTVPAGGRVRGPPSGGPTRTGP